jgi:hypothetical protein
VGQAEIGHKRLTLSVFPIASLVLDTIDVWKYFHNAGS